MKYYIIFVVFYNKTCYLMRILQKTLFPIYFPVISNMHFIKRMLFKHQILFRFTKQERY